MEAAVYSVWHCLQCREPLARNRTCQNTSKSYANFLWIGLCVCVYTRSRGDSRARANAMLMRGNTGEFSICILSLICPNG